MATSFDNVTVRLMVSPVGVVGARSKEKLSGQRDLTALVHRGLYGWDVDIGVACAGDDDWLRMDAPGKSRRGHDYDSQVSFSHGCLSRYCSGAASSRAPDRGRKCLRTNSSATDSPSCRPTSSE